MRRNLCIEVKKIFFIEYSFPSEKYLYLLDFWKERQPQGAALDQRFIKLKKEGKTLTFHYFFFDKPLMNANRFLSVHSLLIFNFFLKFLNDCLTVISHVK